jgi:GTPase Era involved in 16S rRNA processing
MGSEERRKKRLARQKLAKKKSDLNDDSVPESDQQKRNRASSDNKIAKLLAKNEDDLLNFVVKVNKVYQEKLNRPAPFMTFVICGMQSAGKSTIMERFMNAVLNIIQEGTGTRCPLDTTCIHDDTLTKPTCDLSGEELPPDMSGEGLTIADVFKYITTHNKNLAKEDRFSTKELRLVYRARNVQNMRFVDTPGIISNKGQGKDNREDIQDILRNTMKKPNTKLCVLLEPKEFSTNPIIDFCDTTFSGRKWVEDSIFIMNKFDKQFDDSRSGSKANNFFKEFQENDIFPHLVMTPTLAKEDLPAEELFKERQKLLDSASEKESNNFENWILGHEKFLQSNPDDQLLHPTTKKRIGFETTKNVMREVMLEDTARRLPEVLTSLRKELGDCQNNLKILNEKKRFNDPSEVKLVMVQLLQRVQTRMLAYLDGDLETSVKFPHVLQTLDDELQDEEESEWCNRELNHYTEEEDTWRERLSDLDYPKQIQAEKRFHGGKQIHRAIETFGLVMIGENWCYKESRFVIFAYAHFLIF